MRSRLSPKPYDLRVWGHYRLRCYPRSNSASNSIYFTPYFDLPEMKVIEALVRPGDRVIDAGANIGAYSLLLASLVGPSGSVVAVEPAGRSVDRLRENVRINDLESIVHVVPAAVGAHEGTGFVTTDADVSNTLTVRPGNHAVSEVQVTTLDALASGAVAFLKLDVEGFEHEALRGAHQVLESRPLILVEVIEHMLRAAGSSAEDVSALLRSHGYGLFQPVWANQEATLVGPVAVGTGNIFAIPCERLPEVFAALARS